MLIIGMALMMGWMVTYDQWLWFWSKDSLGLSRGAVFDAISWAGMQRRHDIARAGAPEAEPVASAAPAGATR